MIYIEDKSPHLRNILERSPLPLDLSYLDELFGFSFLHGGFEEIDIEREPGVSFNPRPARLAHIILKDAEMGDSDTIAASFLSCVWPTAHSDALERFASRKRLIRLTELSFLAPEELIELSSTNKADSIDAVVIALAATLDRARHLHQCSKKDSQEERDTFVKSIPKYIELGENCCPALALLLSAWLQRATRTNYQQVASHRS